MEIENENLEKENQVKPEDQNLLEAMEEYKKTHSISNEEYNRVLERNKQLTQIYANNEAEKEKEKDPDTVASLRKELFSEDRTDMSNLKTTEKILKLRTKLIESGERDPFLSSDANSQEDFDTAERVAAGLQDMVDQADGDEAYFNSLIKAQVDKPSSRIINRR